MTALDKLYHIDTDKDLLDCLNLFKSTVKGYFKLSSKKEEEALINAIAGGKKAIDPTLYRHYADNFRKAVSSVPVDVDLQTQWQANVARFAAYKAYVATDRIRTAMQEDGDVSRGRAILHTFNRYQAAEYNTAVARARTGKQWRLFEEEEENKEALPNIKWLPSRSAEPREEHMPFYNRVWPKDDPFWTYNQPGTLWNCKCDWEQTEEPPTDGNPTKRISMPGLDENPAETGHIFTDTAPYIAKAPDKVENIALNATRAENLSWAKNNLKGTSVYNDEFGREITFTGAGLKDYINQPIDNPYIKNEIIRQMPTLLKEAKYIGHSDYKSSEILRYSHIFEVKIIWEKYWIIVHEYYNNDISFYSISKSPNVLNGIKKEKHPTA